MFGGALRQSDRLASLVAQLLDASQAQAGALIVEPITTDVSDLVVRAVEAERLGNVTHRWVTRIAPDLRASVDPLRFEQAVVNLLDNAIKFTPAGGTITVQLAGTAATVRLEVTDQGIGRMTTGAFPVWASVSTSRDRSWSATLARSPSCRSQVGAAPSQ